jgi:hypothetical protein
LRFSQGRRAVAALDRDEHLISMNGSGGWLQLCCFAC